VVVGVAGYLGPDCGFGEPEDEQCAGVVAPGPGGEQRFPLVQLRQLLAVGSASGEPTGVAGKSQFYTDHEPTLGAATRGPRSAVSGDTQIMTASAGHMSPAEAGELATVPMLAAVSRQRLRELAAGHRVRGIAAGTVLVRRADPATRLFVVLRGDVSAVVDHRDDARFRYPLISGPCVIDKAAVLAGRAHPAAWVAVSDCRTLILSAATFKTLLEYERGLREHVLYYLAAQVHDTRQALAGAAAGPAAARVARWLLVASRSGASPHIRLPAGQQGIAEELGISRVTVNRALQELVRLGAIRTEPRAVTLLDLSQLDAATPDHVAVPASQAGATPGQST
jgi:CRP/FNR family cyclic AMP-dependent transcriptional regulator